MSLGQVPCAVAKAARPARPAREYFIMFVVATAMIERCSRLGYGMVVCVCLSVKVGALGVAGRHKRWRRNALSPNSHASATSPES
jgi:hypothetical protein